MITYKDKSFCGSAVAEHTCECVITEAEIKEAEELNLPIAYQNFCGNDGEAPDA